MRLKPITRKKPTLFGEIGAMLSIQGASHQLTEELMRLFTFENPAYIQAARFSPWGPPKRIPQYLCLAEQEGGTVFIPRGIDPHTQLSKESESEFRQIQWSNTTVKAPTVFPKLQVALNTEQTALVESFEAARVAKSRPFGSYLFVAPTSAGKTIAQAVIASKTGQRTLVLCLTNLIKRSWMDDLYRAYHLRPKDIGLIQQGTWRIGEHFTLASVQTLARRHERIPELMEHIGCVIVDEADTIKSPSIHNFLLKFPARYFIGATATTSGRKVNHHLEYIFGRPIKRLLGSQSDTATSMALQDVDVIPTTFTYEYQNQNLDFNDLQDHLSGHERRNALIVHHAATDFNSGHSSLVVTNRLEHVHVLQDMLDDKGVKTVRLTGEINASPKEQQRVLKTIFSGEPVVVVATRAAVLRGANLNPLEILHLTMPANRKDLEQLIGRIRRKWRNKKLCIVRYYYDRQVRYLHNFFAREALSCFRKLRVKRFRNTYMA